MTRTVLLTIGRMPKAMDLARAFAGAGWRVVVADPHPWHPLRLSRAVAASHAVPAPAAGKEAYLAAMAELVVREGAELVVPVSEETMHVAWLAGRLPHGVRLYTPPPHALLGLHDKAGFIRRGLEAGLPVPETHALGSAEARALAGASDVVVKPRFSCSGRGVAIVRSGQALPDPAAHEPAIVQRFVPGRIASTFAIAREGRVLVDVAYEAAMLSGTVAVAFRRIEDAAISAWVARFAEHGRHGGFLSFDFVVDESGQPWGIECNPRVTSGIHFVEPESLLAAITDPAFDGPARFRPHAVMQQFWPALTETYARIFDGAARRANFAALRGARDVTWSARDPWPLLLMPFASARILGLSMFRGMSFGEASTFDIAWFDGEAVSAAQPQAPRREARGT